MSDIDERVVKIVAASLGMVDLTRIKPTTQFLEDLKADSVEVVELMMSVEEELGIEIHDEKIETIHTVGDLIAYIKAEQKV